MARVLIARLHSLGDVVLTTGIAHALIHRGDVVDILTLPAYFPVFAGLAYRRLFDPATLRTTSDPYDRVVDLQASQTSRRLLAPWGSVVRRQNSRSLKRRWIVCWGRRRPRPNIPHVVERYGDAAGLQASTDHLRPRIVVTEADRKAASVFPGIDVLRRPLIGLAVGGSRVMKRWPEEAFRELERMLAAEGCGTIGFLPPDRTGDKASSDSPQVRAPLGALKAILSGCDVLVTNDSGVMHLAVGLGIPVVSIFGSTVREFGFAPLGPSDRIIDRDLACRPCAAHGARFCWLGHRRCLRDVDAREVLAAVLDVARESATEVEP